MKEEPKYLCTLCRKCVYKSCIKSGCPYANEVSGEDQCSAYRPTPYWRKRERILANATHLTDALERGQLPKFVIGQKVYIIEYPERIAEAEIVYIHITPDGEARYQIKSYSVVAHKVTTKQNTFREDQVFATQQECWEALLENTKKNVIAQLKNLKYQAERNGVALPDGSLLSLPEKM